jgi:hypothetical protein
MRNTLTWLTALATLLVASLVFAAKSKGVVIVVEGADTDAVRADLAQSMPSGLAVQDATDLTAALASQGVNGSLADALSTPKGRKQTLTGVKKALTQAGVAGVLSARSKKGKTGGREVRLVLILRSQLEPVIEENIVLGKGENAKQKFSPLLGAPLQDVAAGMGKDEPAAEAPKADKTDKAEPKEKESTEAAVSLDTSSPEKDTGPTKKRGNLDFTNAMFVVDAGGEAGMRNFKYSDPVAGALRAYAAPGVAIWSIGAEFYPGATSGIAYAKDIGLVGRFGMALPWESKTREGAQSAIGSWQRYSVGVRGRIKAGDGADAPLVGLELAYGDFKFGFTGDDPVVQEVPAVDYKYVRPGADVRVPFGAFSLLGGAGYMYILSAGAFGDRFPHETIGGVDARLGGSYLFMPWLAGKVTADYVRVFSSAHSEPTDTFPAAKAGGALDQYLILHLGVSAIF